MGNVTLRRNEKGWRRVWYGDFVENGKRRVVTLDVPVKGTPPESMKEKGDTAFEVSRARAQQQLDLIIEEAKYKGNATHLVERVIEMKTGHAVEHVMLEELVDRWEARVRDRDLSINRKALCRVIFGRFLSFMRTRRPAATYLYEIQDGDAYAWRDALREAKFSPATVKEHLTLLRGACAAFLPQGRKNPFVVVAKKALGDDDTVHRQPLTVAEIEKLKIAALNDPLLYPLIVTVLATGMRRGDACRLKWTDVDLAKNHVRVKTSKTGAVVLLPIMADFERVLRAAKDAASKGADFVFPEAAHMIENNPDGLTWRFKVLAVQALCRQKKDEGAGRATLKEVNAFLDAQPKSRKVDDTRKAAELYFQGKGMTTIAMEMNAGKSTVSGWFTWLAKGLGKPVLRGIEESIKNDFEKTRVVRKLGGGSRSASLIDWHALRTSFVTIALENGIPIETVKKITGHKTDAIVCRHYYRPSIDGVRSALAKRPTAITGVAEEAEEAEEAETAPRPAQQLQRLAGLVASGKATDADKKALAALL